MQNKFIISVLFYTFLVGTIFSSGVMFERTTKSAGQTAAAKNLWSYATGATKITTTNTTPTESSPKILNQCIVTLFGKEYDVQPLRSPHPGGDIFVCNTDMTDIYTKQHGTNLTRMKQYLYVKTAQTGTTGTKPVTKTDQAVSIPATPKIPAPSSTQCLVTLFGKLYDVEPLRSPHPGGDIFQCNTDMTTIYANQHGTSVSRMTPYLVTSSDGSTVSPLPTATPTRNQEVENDD